MKEFKGIVAETFTGITTIRGYADFSDLKKYSEPKDYQRELIEKHVQDITEFYDKSNSLFYPEVVLGLELKYDYNLGSSEVLPLKDIKEYKRFKSNVDNIQVEKLKSNKISGIEIASIQFKEEMKPFSRIDGNHRLSADFNNQLSGKYVPFCIVLFESSNINYQEVQIFHNINSKAKPITNEKALSLIISNNDIFDDDYLTSSYGMSYLCTRQLLNSIGNWNVIPIIKRLIYDTKYTYFLDLFDCLKQEVADDALVDTVTNELSNINEALKECENIFDKNNIAILGALAYYKITNLTKFNQFINWISKNDISSIEKLHIEDVMSIFDKIALNIPKRAFLARWYPAETHSEFAKAKHRLNALKTLVGEYNLELIDLGTQTGGTYDIRSVMYQGISKADIFIADLTYARHNVMVEVGYALQFVGEERMLFYFQETDDVKSVPFDLSGFRYEPIQDSGDIIEKLKPHIETILELPQ